MSGILDVSFTLTNKKVRLGYYYDCKGRRGHCFHYTKPIDFKTSSCKLFKDIKNKHGENGVWQTKNIYASYLHIMLRNNFDIINNLFL
jgi:cobyrinic acid a,c-diamide synthase